MNRYARARHFAWILWIGTAAALQSTEHGNMGPYGSWTKSGTFADRELCVAGRDKAVADYLKANPSAVARKKDLVVDKKPLQDDETTIVHTATRYACLPDNAEEPTFADPAIPSEPAAPGGAEAPTSP